MPREPRRWPWSALGLKLFLSYLAVVGVGILTLLLTADALVPRFLDLHLAGMMGAAGRGLGPPAGQLNSMDALLADAFRTSLLQGLLLGGLAALVAAVGASVFVTQRVLGPVRRLALVSRRIAAGQYSARVQAPAGDELGTLAAAFNDLAAALEETEQRRLALIGDVAHELRTPVATIQGYLEGLLDGVVQPTEQTWACLHDETGRLRRLTDDLQELSRAEAHQLPFDLRTVDPSEVVRVATERLRPSFTEKGLNLVIQLPTTLPQVRADPDRAVQILTNLLTNALRYTPAPGRVQLSATAHEGLVEFAVADTGSGISPEHLPRLFERFYRVDKARSRALGGSGIGLTIARALVEAMGGRIWAVSPGLGRGTTFSFTLPAS